MLLMLLLCVLLFGYWYTHRETARKKGTYGEKNVSRRLHRLPAEQYLILDDILLLSDRGLTQIDHIVVSVYGIFIIETKNYAGLITGDQYAYQWYQCIGKKRYAFRNPCMQNYAHCCAIIKLLSLSKENKPVSIVAFSNRAKLCVDTQEHVVYFSQLRRCIRSYHTSIFTQEEMCHIAISIREANLDSKEARERHLEQMETEAAYRNFARKNGLCPRCGGALVLRQGKYSAFYGCRNYPKCRYTQNIDDILE